MKKFGKVLLGLTCVGLSMVIIAQIMIIIGMASSGDGMELSFKENKVIMIRLEGPIFLSKPTLEKLERFKKNKSAPAAVIRLESPGGTVASAQEIYDKILELRKDGKVVIASMGNLAASGAYYISSACDRIVANPGTLTGSIGVIMSTMNISELVKKFGVKMYVVKSGKYKDIFSSFRDMTDDEKKLLQSSIDDTYYQFIDAILKGRQELIGERILGRPFNAKLDSKRVRKFLISIADGRIFTGKQAWKNGLVDALGGLSDSVKLAGKMAGIDGEPVVVEEKDKKSVWDTLLNGLGPGKSTLGKFKTGLFYIMQ